MDSLLDIFGALGGLAGFLALIISIRTQRASKALKVRQLLYEAGDELGISGQPTDWLPVLTREASRLERARRLIEEAETLQPRSGPAARAHGMYLAARGSPGDALAYLRKAVALDPSDATLHANLGVALASFGAKEDDDALLESAEEALRRAATLAPGDHLVVGTLGAVLCQVGKLEEGLNHLDSAIELHSRFAPHHYNRGRCLVLLGRRREGREALEEALSIDSGHAEARNALSLLDLDPET